MVVLVFLFFLINYVKLQDIQHELYTIQQEVENTKSDVEDLNNKCSNGQTDNSDVIQAIEAHHKEISNQIDEAERQIKAHTVIWSN